ncbi:MAG: hypothetical protein GPJ15_02250 [Microcystis aeruginosa G11-06]|jgi:hypothetical protein|nr:hypothetical protein [Microcystis aeruginosa LL11-07]NCS18935.1 hypothetical protein [Microcystis aeruginosa G11-06]NCS45024.1 hypothetical protein [Microcystis aeruginosa BS11-05]NCT42684.1 hypothetical protein [Microcystis aeruginosa G11-09]
MSNNNSNSGCYGWLGIIYLLALIAWFPIGWIILAIGFVIVAISNNSSSRNSSNSQSSPSTSSSFANKNVVPIPDDLNNILIDISQGEIRDMISQETFRPGEKVYLCSVHRLAYHEDSWQYNNCQCSSCGHGNSTKAYTVPSPVHLRQIKWEDRG